jgi:hypothetical protein
MRQTLVAAIAMLVTVLVVLVQGCGGDQTTTPQSVTTTTLARPAP